jgi:single-strand DNA-binding protein
VQISNLVGDPELRFTPTGAPVTNFSVADNRRWQDRTTQEWQESTSYFDVVAWADLAQRRRLT